MKENSEQIFFLLLLMMDRDSKSEKKPEVASKPNVKKRLIGQSK